MGRPKKFVDEGVFFHMLKNGAPVSKVANFLGIHRDTLYARYTYIIQKGRQEHEKQWRIIIDPIIEEIIRTRAEKRARKYR